MGGLAGVTCGRVSAVEEVSLWEGRLAVNIWEGNSSELPQVHVHVTCKYGTKTNSVSRTEECTCT